jgi:hypothetical protein
MLKQNFLLSISWFSQVCVTVMESWLQCCLNNTINHLDLAEFYRISDPPKLKIVHAFLIHVLYSPRETIYPGP